MNECDEIRSTKNSTPSNAAFLFLKTVGIIVFLFLYNKINPGYINNRSKRKQSAWRMELFTHHFEIVNNLSTENADAHCHVGIASFWNLMSFGQL